MFRYKNCRPSCCFLAGGPGVSGARLYRTSPLRSSKKYAVVECPWRLGSVWPPREKVDCVRWEARGAWCMIADRRRRPSGAAPSVETATLVRLGGEGEAREVGLRHALHRVEQATYVDFVGLLVYVGLPHRHEGRRQHRRPAPVDRPVREVYQRYAGPRDAVGRELHEVSAYDDLVGTQHRHRLRLAAAPDLPGHRAGDPVAQPEGAVVVRPLVRDGDPPAGYRHVHRHLAAIDYALGYVPRVEGAGGGVEASQRLPREEHAIVAGGGTEGASRKHCRLVAGEGEAANGGARFGPPHRVQVAREVERRKVAPTIAVHRAETAANVDLRVRRRKRLDARRGLRADHRVDVRVDYAREGVYRGEVAAGQAVP